MDRGGTFNIERRQLSSGIWQITESHVHINGKALLFKNIGEQEDDVKSEFQQMPQDMTLGQAAGILRSEPTELNADRRCCSMR
jgi:muramoyltetrapeptide carboxypeptidase LdcA involved in peptidoglycan recycling